MESYLEQFSLKLIDSCHATRGRYIQTTQTIPKGHQVITSEPLAVVIFSESQRDYCNYCFKKNPRQRCSRCKKAYFCDVFCFQKAWASYHQFNCGTCVNPELDMLEKVAVNVEQYQKMIRGNNPIDVTMEAFFSLTGHSAAQPAQLVAHYRQLAQTAIKKEHLHTDLEKLVHYQCVFASNNFTIDDAELFAIGQGTYPIASLFNHSCRPNAVVLFEGTLAKIRVIEDIPAHTEITIAYLDAAHSKRYRQKTLKEKYFFDCGCMRCGTHNEIDRMLGEEEDEWDRAAQVLGQDNNQSTNIKKQIKEWDIVRLSSLDNLDPTSSLSHYTHHFLNSSKDVESLMFKESTEFSKLSTLKMCSRMFYDAMGEGQWPEAARLGMYVLVQYRLIYPANHPMLAQHYLTLAKGHWNALVQTAEEIYEEYFEKWIALAQKTILITFGVKSSLWKEVMELASLQ
ncbi:hypothetical protein G6F56_004125 [Rhizopus delemar]|uniref:SET and MYND domain-containing protein 3 n=1 Tax=Rhizopus stolonifer TaxID=4846 RepID=A0A367JER0_RHIST|nr:hypothetical protein G6F56_004125 [Rhizopus delemar]RCH88397.1 SET and MYND domain-containing protein 3 [Rhizopus stolonifer]